MRIAGARAWLIPSLLTALAYAAAGQLALLLALVPSQAAPIYPSAGIALAAVLVAGRRALPGVLLGSFCVNALIAPRPLPWVQAGGLALVIALGATAQAALGDALLRRRGASGLALSEPRDVLRFCLLGAAASCLLNSTLSTTVQVLAGVIPPDAALFTWWTWWSGDALGVLIGTPIVLTLIGRPRADWAPRRLPLGLPMAGLTALLVLATLQVSHWDQQRQHDLFERAAIQTAEAVTGRLREAEHALLAMQGLFVASPEVSREAMRRAAAPWLELPIKLQAIGYGERVARSDLAAFAERASAADRRELRVFERRERGGSPISAGDADLVVVRYAEPEDRNAAVLGVNMRSVPAVREALVRAVASAAPAATAGFRLTQEVGDQTGVVLYQALYRGEPMPDNRAQALRGVVFVTLRMDQSIGAVTSQMPPYLSWCLIDTDPAAARPRLAGAVGCDSAAAAGELHFARDIELGGRHWRLMLAAQARTMPESGRGNAWLFSFVGLLSAALLAALLLTVTGRARRIESAVAERTSELEREVGERERTESALRESEQRLRNILDHAPIGIVYADLAGRIREANPKLRQMVGYGAGELARLSLQDLTHPDDRANDAEQLDHLLRGEIEQVRRRKRLLHRDGPEVWVQSNLSVLRGAGGQAQRLVAVIEDITEHLRLQAAEQAREVAESANRAKSEFLSRMSHELRTPLNAMLGFAQLLDMDRKPVLAPHHREWTAQIQHAGWHLLEMINDTLDLSRIEAGTLRLDTRPIELDLLLDACVAMAQPMIARRSITLRRQIDPQARSVLADPTRLKQVLTNLLSNAVKYNVEGGRVDVSTALDTDGRVELRVRDTGPGLSAAQMDELFQPFNRLGQEHGAIEGTGIGLVISRRLAELMGGRLDAQSQPGQGSTFVLSLPAAKEPGAVGAAPELDPLFDPDYSHRHLLYVEDNETNAEVMRGILAQRPQVRMEVCSSGLDGLASVRARHPDLILLDMHLPDIDGLELLRHLRQDVNSADIPVVVVSADATRARINDAIAAGAVRYLTKPLNIPAFLEVLDGLLEQLDTRFS